MYVEIKDGVATLTSPTDFRLARKDIAFPAKISDELLKGFSIYPLVDGPQPPCGKYEQYIRDQIIDVDGVWTQTYRVEPWPSEQAAAAVREERDALLVASDWTQVADAPVDQAAWATYRQALRDITAQAGFPHNVIWPTAP